MIMVTDPKYCPMCKHYTNHELITTLDKKSGTWKCLQCGQIDQYNDFPARGKKCDCGGSLVPHPDGSGLLQCQKCKAFIFIMNDPPKHMSKAQIPLEKTSVDLELPTKEWPRLPGANKTAINVTSILHGFGKIEPPKRFDSDEIKKTCSPASNAIGGITPEKTDRPAASDTGSTVSGKAGNEKCLKCGLNSWEFEIDNGIEIFTCKTKGCNFKAYHACANAIQGQNQVVLCNKTNASCNGTRITKQCVIKNNSLQGKKSKNQTTLF